MKRDSWYPLLVAVCALVILQACTYQVPAPLILQPIAPVEAQSVEDVAAVTAALNEIWDHYASSLKAGDADGWISLWTDNGVQMPPGSPPVVGKDQIGAGTRGFLDAYIVDSFEVDNEEVIVTGDWAIARGTFAGAYTPKAGGEAFYENGKFMTILQRQPDGSWKIHRDIFNLNSAVGDASGPEKADNLEDMVGTWRSIGSPSEFYLLYFEDGTYHCSSSLERLEEWPSCKGEFWFEGTQYYDKETQGGCTSYDAGVYEVFMQSNGNLKFVLIEDECAYRVYDQIGRGPYEGLTEYEPVP